MPMETVAVMYHNQDELLIVLFYAELTGIGLAAASDRSAVYWHAFAAHWVYISGLRLLCK